MKIYITVSSSETLCCSVAQTLRDVSTPSHIKHLPEMEVGLADCGARMSLFWNSCLVFTLKYILCLFEIYMDRNVLGYVLC